jgi:hypothetical protein
MNASGGYVLGRAVPEEVGGGSDRNESDRPVADDNAPGKVVSAPNTSGPSTEGVGRQASSVRMVPLGERAPLPAASLDDFMKPYETFQFCKLVDLKTYEDPRHPDDDAAASEVPKNQARYVHFRLKTGKNPVSGFLETAFPEVIADTEKNRFLFPRLRLQRNGSFEVVTALKLDAHKAWHLGQKSAKLFPLWPKMGGIERAFEEGLGGVD